MKRLAHKDEVLRPITAEEDGTETLHKFKYQRMASLVDVEVRKRAQGSMCVCVCVCV